MCFLGLRYFILSLTLCVQEFRLNSGSESHFGFNGSKEFVLEFCLFSTHIRNKMDEVLAANQNAHNYATNI